MITSFPENLYFDMFMAEEVAKIEAEELEKRKTGKGKKPYVGDVRKDDPDVQDDIALIAKRKKPVMSRSKIIKTRNRMMGTER